MASDVWGHDLDSDGNIVQDVNPELFTAIINHLRLKAIVWLADKVPPICIYKQENSALENMLSFYLMDDVPVAYIELER